MPYIPKSKRKYFDTLFNPDSDITHPGSLNYTVTQFILDFVKRNGGDSDLADEEVIGMLMCCMLEYWRRRAKTKNIKKKEINYTEEVTSYRKANNIIGKATIQMLNACSIYKGNSVYNYYMTKVAKYEDLKIKENGDVY